MAAAISSPDAACAVVLSADNTNGLKYNSLEKGPDKNNAGEDGFDKDSVENGDPVESDPETDNRGENDFDGENPNGEDPDGEGSDEENSDEGDSDGENFTEEDPDGKDSDEDDPDEEIFDGENPDEDNPDVEDSDGEDPDGENPEGEDPDEEDPDEDIPDEDDPDEQSPDGEDPDEDDFDNDNPDEEDINREVSHEEDPDGEGPEGEDHDGEDPDGENPDGDDSDGDVPAGEFGHDEEDPDGEDPDGEYDPNGEAPDGENPDGEDIPEENSWNDAWPEDGLAALLPVPEGDLDGLIIYCDYSSQFRAALPMDEDDYESYIASCMAQGFDHEAVWLSDGEGGFSSTFQAFNGDGYKLELRHNLRGEGYCLDITIKFPMPLGTLNWWNYDLGLLLPEPRTTVGVVRGSPEIFLDSYLGEMPLESYHEYIEACKEAGFNQNVMETEREFSATDEDGIEFSASYYGNSIMWLRLFDPEQKWRSKGLGQAPAGGGSDGTDTTDGGPDGTDSVGGGKSGEDSLGDGEGQKGPIGSGKDLTYVPGSIPSDYSGPGKSMTPAITEPADPATSHGAGKSSEKEEHTSSVQVLDPYKGTVQKADPYKDTAQKDPAQNAEARSAAADPNKTRAAASLAADAGRQSVVNGRSSQNSESSTRSRLRAYQVSGQAAERLAGNLTAGNSSSSSDADTPGKDQLQKQQDLTELNNTSRQTAQDSVFSAAAAFMQKRNLPGRKTRTASAVTGLLAISAILAGAIVKKRSFMHDLR